MGGAAALGGGRGGVMTGASGACAVVVADLVREKGVEHLSAAVLLAGAMQIAVGKARRSPPPLPPPSVRAIRRRASPPPPSVLRA